MQAGQSLFSLRRHWAGFVFLLPIFPLEAIYHARAVAERIPRVSRGSTDPIYEYHLSAFTSFLGSSLFWIFWGGMVAFAIHAVYVRELGRRWLWAKLLFLPFYFLALILWSFHVE